jgi:poly(A) polymerase
VPSIDLNRALRELNPALPPFLQAVAGQTQGDVWVVGGFLRDLLLKRQPYDLDLAVSGSARQTAEALARAFEGHPFALDDERGTFRVALPEAATFRTIDVSSLRGGAIEADLAERDFSVDAMASHLRPDELGTLIDPLGGYDDTRNANVRMVSERSLRDDPLRLLRAVRLAVELDFEVEAETASAIGSQAASVLGAAPERQRDELLRILASPRAASGMRLMDSLGLLEALLPELTRARGVVQPERHHHYDVFDHCIETLAVADWLLSVPAPVTEPAESMYEAFWETLDWYPMRDYLAATTGGQSRLVLAKLAALLHDIAKPETKSIDETGRVRFLGHSEAGAQVGRDICRRFRMGNREAAFVGLLIEEHLRPGQLSQGRSLPSDRAVFRFFRDLDEAAPACLVLTLADAAAALGPRLQLSRWRGHVAYISHLLERAGAQRQGVGGRHFISGATLMQALDLSPGPDIGRLLAALDEAAASGELSTEEEAVELARQLRESWQKVGAL